MTGVTHVPGHIENELQRIDKMSGSMTHPVILAQSARKLGSMGGAPSDLDPQHWLPTAVDSQC